MSMGEGLTQFIFGSTAVRKILEITDRAAPSNLSVLLLGESGTGKEVLAQRLHQKSTRRDRPFLAVNCGAIHENLLVSELFGFEEGAFTGAHRTKAGLVEEADGGTLFLDEIGELPLGLQAQLLRFLQTGEFYRLGSSVLRKVNVRVVSATNRDLTEAMKHGSFREDLYFRLSGIQVTLPPLRERREDILPLLQLFLGISPLGVSSEVREALLRYDWPGNIRELKNVVERMKVLCAGSALDWADLPLEIRRNTKVTGEWPMPPPTVSLEEVERRHVLNALQFYDGNKSRAALSLGVTVKTLYNRLTRLAASTDEIKKAQQE